MRRRGGNFRIPVPATERAPSPEACHEVAARSDAAEVEAALSRFPAADRLQSPLALALRATRSVLDGDVPGGTALLRRAVGDADDVIRPFLIDLLVPLLVSAGDFDGAEELLDECINVAPTLEASFLSARAVLSASRGNDNQSRHEAEMALGLGRALDNETLRARVLQRIALAAFYRADWYEAQDRAIEAARAQERIGSYRQAAHAYTILYAIAHGALGDPDLARFYAEKLATSGRLAKDASMQNLGIVAQMAVAAESGDQRRLASMRARLLANQMNSQYRERFAYVLSDILSNAWAGRLGAAQALTSAVMGSSALSPGERATCEAFMALFAVASWNLDEARKFARSAVHHTAERAGPEALYELQQRRAARILAVSAMLLMGEPSRAHKALTRAFDPDGVFARIITERGIQEEAAPILMRGYARLVNAVYAASNSSKPQHELTQAEMAILRALPQGATLDALAESLRKSPQTLKKQLTSIYRKLEVSNRVQAIERGRELGLYR